MLKQNNYKILICLISMLLILSFRKNQNGDFFRTSAKSSFLLDRNEKQLKSLQMMEVSYLGDLFKSKNNVYNDNFLTLVEMFPEIHKTISNIFEIDQLKISSGSINRETWSYHAFPIYKGGLANRFQDPIFQNGENWIDLYNEYLNNPTENLISNNLTNKLSSIEKYEFLIGNLNFDITKSQWDIGKKFNDQEFEIPKWMGYCHGTAPASINNLRPSKSIHLLSADQHQLITFYPSDIKALISYAWAMNSNPSAIVGSKCDKFLQPNIRPSLNCLDTNPSTFFLTAINLIGMNQIPFIIDSSAGIEIWNRSIISYDFKYFKPGSRNLTQNINLAIIPITQYKNDPYKIYRNPETNSLVGINMEINYKIGTMPTNFETDSIKNDLVEKTNYWFDLEIDKDGILIGGEWYELNHPDFIWITAPNLLPKTTFDYSIGESLNYYTGKKSLPTNILNFANLAAKQNTVLYSLIEAMLRLSQN